MTDQEIVQALRQCAKSDCSSCGMCPIFPDRECVEHLAAADASLIERLTAENVVLPDGQASAIESLRKEIEWKDMVISLAQRKQAEAETERDALREKVPQWISVEERRPEPGKRVIATDGVFVGEAYRTSADTWRRYDGIAMRDCLGSIVTHWMPLPEAPEAHNGKENS